MNKAEEDRLSSVMFLVAAVFASVLVSFFISRDDWLGVILFSVTASIYGFVAIYSFYQSTKRKGRPRVTS